LGKLLSSAMSYDSNYSFIYIFLFRGGNNHEDYFKSREKYLEKWLHTILQRQSTENIEFRVALMNFLVR
jgi:hypothetical protein